MDGMRSCLDKGKQEEDSPGGRAEEDDPASLYLAETYHFHLPSRLIAQEPLPNREESRMMMLSREDGGLEHRSFREIGACLRKGDLVVVNNSKVLPARILGNKPSGGRVELLLLQPSDPRESLRECVEGEAPSPTEWDCLIRSSGRPRKGLVVRFDRGGGGEVTCGLGHGIWRVRFQTEGLDFFAFLDRVGLPPLPPYIKRDPARGEGVDPALDRERYQTVFARAVGSVAAPTAGFHFSEGLCRDLRAQGIGFVEITLHVGQATFLPVRERDVRDHKVWPERFDLTPQAAEEIQKAQQEGRRVVAVGTTVVRCLESLANERKQVEAASGWAALYVLPGFRFRVVDALLTNFHLPRSSLLLLVSAFAGADRVRRAYEEAVRNEYRFFSYGDCMLIQ
jgi:S-adenosylmethionine:tRNA ribosyltransferase-isomerase